LSEDGLEPHLSISVGQAIYPKDGTSIEQLLGTADLALYKMKGRKVSKVRLSQIVACL
jgi:GGDEF domain-containing protein